MTKRMGTTCRPGSRIEKGTNPNRIISYAYSKGGISLPKSPLARVLRNQQGVKTGWTTGSEKNCSDDGE